METQTETAAILFNPSSGKGRSLKEKKKVRQLLETNGIGYQWFESRSEEHLAELAAETARQFGVIVGVGGDTTFNIMVREFLDSPRCQQITMGMMGTGSANDIVRGLGIHRLEDACMAIKNGLKRGQAKNTVKKMDVGRVELVKNNKTQSLYFLGTLSAGLGTTVNRYVEDYYHRRPLMAKINPFTQLWAGLTGIRHSFSNGTLPMSVDIRPAGTENAETIEFSLLVFLNTPYYANGLELGRPGGLLDGQLDACIIGTTSFGQTFKTALAVRKSIKNENIRVISAPNFEIIPAREMDIQVDGDIIESVERFTVSILPGKLKVFAKLQETGASLV